MVRPSSRPSRLAVPGLVGLGLLLACSSSEPPVAAGVRHVGGGRPWTPNAPWTPEPARTRALMDLGPEWMTRSQIGSLYEGKVVYVRNRSADATGPSSPANTHPFQVVLGDRNGSRGADADRDGLSDAAERALGSDPMSVDSDGDTIPDGFEIFATGTLPTTRDSDGDGTPDNVELDLDDPATYADSDGDGLLDGQERAYFGTDPRTGDSDGDGFGDDYEYYFGTAMNDRTHPTGDSDRDGMPDDFETAGGSDPQSASSKIGDADDDDLPDWLDPDVVMQSRVRGRPAAVPAAATSCNFNKQNV